ncbi:MAG: ATPase, T2SS/T4P/T4SS family [Planctomycetota bacterium]|nr:ATPase, T2SS/T4P/T4SS family [Planctomycetota bacterium]
MPQERKPLGKILEEMKAATGKQIKECLEIQRNTPGKRLGEILIEKGITSQATVTEALAKQFDMPFLELSALEISPEVLAAIPKEVAEEYKIFPVKKDGRAVTIAMSDPLDFFTLDNLRFILNCEVECVLATRDDVIKAIRTHYITEQKDDMMRALEELTSTDIQVRGEQAGDEHGDEDDDAPVIKLVTLIIVEAVKVRASDVHVEPMEKKLRIRYRIDGVCQEVESPPKRLQGSVISRLKIMADIDIAEKRKPQDGRIKINALGKELDLRVSALPATHGESIVMRILDKQASLVGLEDLGFHPSDFKRFKTIIKRPNGIFLVTGPTGSGKTTTLYAAIKDLNKPDVKIITAENPVEYNLAGINQSQVNAKIGMTFQRILRAMLRQAPNIILVGEIRDRETAEIATQAALTGHLVFSTLHTNDAPSAITRLIDMGVKPFLVASSIQAIMGQRLIRMLCPACKAPYEPEDSDLSALGLKRSDVAGVKFQKGVGCPECGNKGFRGRKGVFEMLEMDKTLRDMAFNKAPTNKIMEQARLGGMTTLLEDGVRKVIAGLTTVGEILNIAHREDVNY